MWNADVWLETGPVKAGMLGVQWITQMYARHSCHWRLGLGWGWGFPGRRGSSLGKSYQACPWSTVLTLWDNQEPKQELRQSPNSTWIFSECGFLVLLSNADVLNDFFWQNEGLSPMLEHFPVFLASDCRSLGYMPHVLACTSRTPVLFYVEI